MRLYHQIALLRLKIKDMKKIHNNHVQDTSVNLDQHNIDEVPATLLDKMENLAIGVFLSLLQT